MAVVADRGPSEAAAYAAAIAGTLRDDVGVSPAPFSDASFSGKQCHEIGARLSALWDRLDAFLFPVRAAAHHRSCRLWADLIPVLNRTSPIDSSERIEFRQRAAALVDGTLADFLWASITPKLHALACHASDLLDEFGSLGLFEEEGLEAWHGYVNQNAAVLAAPTFLSSCVRLAERAEIGWAPGSEAFNRDKLWATASPRSRSAKRACDVRTNRGREAACVSREQSTANEARAAEDGDKWATNMHAVAVLMIATYNKTSPQVSTSGPPPSEDSEDGALLAKARAMCVPALFKNWH